MRQNVHETWQYVHINWETNLSNYFIHVHTQLRVERKGLCINDYKSLVQTQIKQNFDELCVAVLKIIKYIYLVPHYSTTDLCYFIYL
jgi:hypothetical protein